LLQLNLVKVNDFDIVGWEEGMCLTW